MHFLDEEGQKNRYIYCCIKVLRAKDFVRHIYAFITTEQYSVLPGEQYRFQNTELFFQKMPNFTTNQKFLENFVLIFAKDNTDCFLFCNLGSTLLKREDLLKFVFFFQVAYLKIRSCAQCYCIWRFLVTNFTLLAFLVIFCPNLSFFENNSVFCDR